MGIPVRFSVICRRRSCHGVHARLLHVCPPGRISTRPLSRATRRRRGGCALPELQSRKWWSTTPRRCSAGGTGTCAQSPSAPTFNCLTTSLRASTEGESSSSGKATRVRSRCARGGLRRHDGNNSNNTSQGGEEGDASSRTRKARTNSRAHPQADLHRHRRSAQPR